MAKPASGTALDTGHALYTSLEAVWGFLEGTGTTTADSKGSNTGTLSSSGLWSTDANGAILHNTNAATDRPVAVTQFAFDGLTDFSIAFGAKQTTSNSNGMVMGDPDGTTNYLWFNGGTYLRVLSPGGGINFSGVTSFTTYADYVFTYDYTAGVSTLSRLYVNGTITSDGALSATIDLTIDALMGAFSSLSLVGDLSYVYVWRGRVLSGAEATTLASNPYVIFQAGSGPAFVARPNPFRGQAVNRAGTY